jgi:hypothetical protein
MNKPTYNNYIAAGLADGSLKVEEFEGVRFIKVRKPLSGEEVVGFSSLSAFSHDYTPTEVASK